MDLLGATCLQLDTVDEEGAAFFHFDEIAP